MWGAKRVLLVFSVLAVVSIGVSYSQEDPLDDSIGMMKFFLTEDEIDPDVEFGVFRWYCSLPGDYDGNGEVGISDITPLGRYVSLHGWSNPDVRRDELDGDGNGEITIADLSVIGANLGSVLPEFELRMSDAPPALAGTTSQLSVEVDRITIWGPKRSFDLAASEPVDPDMYYWIEGLSADRPVISTVLGGDAWPPRVSEMPENYSGTVGSVIQFDVSMTPTTGTDFAMLWMSPEPSLYQIISTSGNVPSFKLTYEGTYYCRLYGWNEYGVEDRLLTIISMP